MVCPPDRLWRFNFQDRPGVPTGRLTLGSQARPTGNFGS